METQVCASDCHSGCLVSDFAMGAVMNFANWPLVISVVQFLPTISFLFRQIVHAHQQCANDSDKVSV